MIKSTKAEISSMSLMPNKLIVKLTRKPDEIILDKDLRMYLQYSFAHEENAPTRGEVVNITKRLDCSLMNWITPLEIKVGDEVVYNYLAAMDAWVEDESKTMVDEEKNLYFMLDYEDMFCVRRKTILTPVNGYVLCSPVDNVINTKLIIPKFARKRSSDKFGQVKHIGVPNIQYHFLTEEGIIPRKDLKDINCLSVGDIVLFDKHCDLPIESSLHGDFAGRKEVLFRMQSCYIKAVVPKNFVKGFGIMQKM